MRRFASPILRRRRRAFSLIELLVVVALLSIIILGLLLMFNQTQKAFRTGMAQVDVLESGRAATEMLSRELLQMTPANSYRSNDVNYGVSFYVGLPNYTPLRQPLPGSSTPAEERENLLEEMFFLTRYNRTWAGIGYLVTPPNEGVATLYRYYGTNSPDPRSPAHDPGMLFESYRNASLTNMSRIIDGVVHFKVRAYDTNGVWIDRVLNLNITNIPPVYAFGEVRDLRFYSNAVPAFVEFELGILEQRTLERAKSIPVAARRAYLEKQAGRVHLFRMRVPIRNVDPTAYQP